MAEPPRRCNAAAWFVDRHVAAARGDRTALVADGRPLAYRTVFENVNRTGHALPRLGEAAGDTLAFADLIRAESTELAPAPTTRDDPAFWLYTSGTTGTPKAAVHLQHDMRVCCEGFARHVLEIVPDDRCFSVAKLFFAYGLGNALYFPFAVGAAGILHSGRPEPAKVLELIT